MPEMCKEKINDLIWVVAAEPLDNRILRLTFNNGSVKTFDCKPLIKEQNVFGALQDEAIFRKIALDGWTITWQNGEIDIAPEYLYEKGVSMYEVPETMSNHVAANDMPYNSEK